jgi:ribosomal protein L37AE/L43A
MTDNDLYDQNATLNCPSCKKPFTERRQTQDRFTYIFCKRCKAIIAVFTDHSVTNSFDLRKIKEKLGVVD